MQVIRPSRRTVSKMLLATMVPTSAAKAQTGRPIRLLLPLSGVAPDITAEARDIADAALLAATDFARAEGRALAGPGSWLGEVDTGRSLSAKPADWSAGARLILGPLFARDAAAVGRAAPGVPVITFSNDRTVGRPGLYVFGFQPEAEAGALAVHVARAGFGALSAFGPAGPLLDRTRAALRRTDPNLVATSYGPEGPAGAAERHVAALLARGPRVTPVVYLTAASHAVRRDAEALQRASRAYGPLQLAGGASVAEAASGEPGPLAGAVWAAADPLVRRDFEQRFRETFARQPGRLAGLGYDAAYLAAILYAEGRIERAAIERSNGYFGVDGLFRFGRDGVVERALAVLQAGADGPRVIAPAPRVFPE